MEISQLSAQYGVRRLTPLDVDGIYELLRKQEIFYRFHPPMATRESILEDMEALPPKKSTEDKYFIGFFEGDGLAAVMDLIAGYPDPQTAFVGLFAVNADSQKSGVGTKIISDCVAALGREGFQKIRLAIDKGNPQSRAFWLKNGFSFTGEEYPNDVSAYLVMEKAL